jgi:hypothetical protein
LHRPVEHAGDAQHDEHRRRELDFGREDLGSEAQQAVGADVRQRAREDRRDRGPDAGVDGGKPEVERNNPSLTPKATKNPIAINSAVVGSTDAKRSAAAAIPSVPVTRYSAPMLIRNRNDPSRFTIAKMNAAPSCRGFSP